MLILSSRQIEKLSDLFMDIAKGSYLGALALPVLTQVDIMIFLRLAASGIVCTYFSLKLLEFVEGEK